MIFHQHIFTRNHSVIKDCVAIIFSGESLFGSNVASLHSWQSFKGFWVSYWHDKAMNAITLVINN